MRKKTRLLFFLFMGALQLGSLFWMRSEYRSTLIDGEEYMVPAEIDFTGDFYDRNYVSFKVSVPPVPWKGAEPPQKGDQIYVSLTKDKAGMMQFGEARENPPSGSYLTTRVNGTEGDKVYFTFPVYKLYLSKGQMEKLPVVELSERVMAKDEEDENSPLLSPQEEKNRITAVVRVKDGDGAASKLLANGSPIENTYRTVGTKMHPVYENGSEAAKREGEGLS